MNRMPMRRAIPDFSAFRQTCLASKSGRKDYLEVSRRRNSLLRRNSAREIP
jgi:hypothetical protein